MEQIASHAKAPLLLDTGHFYIGLFCYFYVPHF